NSFNEDIIDCDHIMNLDFSRKRTCARTLRSLVISCTYNNSNVYSNIRLINSLGRLMGVAPDFYYGKLKKSITKKWFPLKMY
ncbi:MAG: hypothetical protein AABX24_02235, partial [Nanoarchaeota archaeon]